MRLFRAYFRRFGEYAMQPSQQPECVTHEGKDYVILSNVNGILAVYRIIDSLYGFTLKYINKQWFESHVWNKETPYRVWEKEKSVNWKNANWIIK